MPNVIVLSPIAHVNYPPEVIASAAITPGMLVEFVPSGGDAGQLRAHATANGNAAPMFACESLVPSIANSQTNPIDLAYADGDSVRWVFARGGDVINAILPASATAVVRGSFLVSNGDGRLRLYVPQATNEGGTATYTTQVCSPIAIADEAVDNSAGGTPVRCRVRVI